ncbi:MAG: inorganic phosphate transporter [Deltaproteobacteria bacterium]|nr:MAG: inorganic phosphate transporter [Deltaproteobacteria bacterium]
MLIVVVVIVVVFDFTNGFHDAADMIATAIASRAVRPNVAIALVCFATFLGPLTAGLAVATTLGNFVDLGRLSTTAAEAVVVSALLAAVIYNVITWVLGYPSSSSNSLAGGLVGAALAAAGPSTIHWGLEALAEGRLVGFAKVFSGLVLSPILGFAVGFGCMKLMTVVLRRFTVAVRRPLVVTQYFTIAGLGYSHGANDAQKGMAIIGMMLLAHGVTPEFDVPLWAIVLPSLAITLGTAAGGWRIIKTLGFGIYRVRTIHAVANQTSAGLVNALATAMGAPTSTSQVVTAALVGNGAAEKPRHVKWLTVAGIVGGWWFNFPVSIALGWLLFPALVSLIGGQH